VAKRRAWISREALLSGEDEFAALPQVMARLAADPGPTLCHRIRY